MNMEYNRIIAITGLGGLFELLSSKSDGAIVRSLEDNQTKFVSSRLHNFSHLESIEVYTVRENINLVDLFQAIQASGEPLPSEKDAAATKAFFAKVYPDMDFDRIYNSDMKKMVKWYSLLTAANVEFKLAAPTGEAEEGEEADEVDETGEGEVATAPPATKAKAKTTEAAEAAEAPAEKPAKEANAPKTDEAEAAADEASEKPKKKAAKPAEETAAAKKPAAPKKKKTDE
jgi:hypothetical protein